MFWTAWHGNKHGEKTLILILSANKAGQPVFKAPKMCQCVMLDHKFWKNWRSPPDLVPGKNIRIENPEKNKEKNQKQKRPALLRNSVLQGQAKRTSFLITVLGPLRPELLFIWKGHKLKKETYPHVLSFATKWTRNVANFITHSFVFLYHPSTELYHKLRDKWIGK